MRKVKYMKYNARTYKYDIECYGLFHCWGLEMDEGDSEDRFNNYTVAIIENEDGTMWTDTPNRITFLD